MSDDQHAKPDPAKFEKLNDRLKAMSPDESLLVASAFSNLLSLHNLSEEARSHMRAPTPGLCTRPLRGGSKYPLKRGIGFSSRLSTGSY